MTSRLCSESSDRSSSTRARLTLAFGVLQKVLHSRSQTAAADITGLLQQRAQDGASPIVSAATDIKAVASLLRKHSGVVAGDQPSSSYSATALAESATLLPLLAAALPGDEELSGQDKSTALAASAAAHVLLQTLPGRQSVPAAQKPALDATLMVRFLLLLIEV